MRIRDFFSTLNFAIATLNDDKNEGINSFENNFDDNMQSASAYIKKIIRDKIGDEEVDSSTLDKIVIEDYDKIIDNTFHNTNVGAITKKYIATRYLAKHRDKIPELEQEIQERGLTYDENELYTDDFHQNLLAALLSLKNDFQEYYDENKANGTIDLLDIENMVQTYGKAEAFKRINDQFGKDKGMNFIGRRLIMNFAYTTIFGIEGIDEKKYPQSSSIMKIKKSNMLKDYIDDYLGRMEVAYKEELADSVYSTISLIDRFGKLSKGVDKHNDKMRRIGLPGLGYYSEDKPIYEGLPKVKDLIKKEELSKLDIDVLLRMNSCYNNRFAKIISDYSMALFIIANVGSIEDCLHDKTLTKKEMTQSELNALLIKYQTLLIPSKTFFAERQKELDENPYSENYELEEIEVGENEVQKQVVLDPRNFKKNLKKVWGNEYKKYFDYRLQKSNNNLEDDISFMNLLYNPVFLAYQFKNTALKTEYAYLHYLSQEYPEKSLNFGVVLEQSDNKDGKSILLASDGGLNLPNRLHTIKRDIVDFLVSYTGSPLARIYEGFNDFKVGGEYISAQLLLPNAKEHAKYLKGLKRGKVKEGDTVSRINVINQDFVDHITYCMDSSQFMKSHKIQKNVVNSKGQLTTTSVQPVRYIDLTDGTIYYLESNGKLVNKKTGQVYGDSTNERDRDE